MKQIVFGDFWNNEKDKLPWELVMVLNSDVALVLEGEC